MQETNCLLCKVVRGERHAKKLIETDPIIGVMSTLEPLASGHCVFFAKQHTPNFHDMEEPALAEILLCIRRVVRAMALENYNNPTKQWGARWTDRLPCPRASYPHMDGD